MAHQLDNSRKLQEQPQRQTQAKPQGAQRQPQGKPKEKLQGQPEAHFRMVVFFLRLNVLIYEVQQSPRIATSFLIEFW